MGTLAVVSAGPPLPGAKPASLLRTLLFATLVPTIAVLLGFGFLADQRARRGFEDELGKRLTAVAVGAALLVQPFQIAEMDPTDEGSNTYANLRRRLELARTQFAVRRVLLLANDLTGRGDSDGRVDLGAKAHELGADAVEVARAFAGQPTASPLFVGQDGRVYKRAYAPVGTPAQGLIAIEGSADYFESLAKFRRWLALAGVVGLSLIVALTVLAARHITRPLGRLAQAADAIGRGELNAPVPVETRDEVGLLATRLDEMRAALRARDERLQMMLAGIAHEVRNPLGGLELYAGLLRDALAGQDERLEEVRRIDREIGHLKTVVTEFLDYARRPRLERARTPLRPLLEEAVEVALPPGARVRLDIDADLHVNADSIQLRRALVNLLRNAGSAAGPSGDVVLAARAGPAGTVEVEVRDSGPGVPDDMRAKIFDPFFTTREKGTGLGLAFVREIVREHGGDVDVTRAPEGGARFAFRLPDA